MDSDNCEQAAVTPLAVLYQDPSQHLTMTVTTLLPPETSGPQWKVKPFTQRIFLSPAAVTHRPRSLIIKAGPTPLCLCTFKVT